MTPEPTHRGHRRRGLFAACAGTIVLAAMFLPPSAPALADPEPRFVWPVRGPVIQAFEAPGSPYGPGHRGIDIAASLGTPVLAPAGGVVSFAGWVAGALFVSIDHGDGIISTSSWLSGVSVGLGDRVAAGAIVGRTGHGHAEIAIAHLHFGVRIHGRYVDPMLLLGPLSVVGLIRLAPLEGSEGR